ncbi:MAG: type II secretion system F family protein [Campylobacterota bacterium]|nr:type II secretion system F family protein [Campylobacterota bacterium]
MKFFEILYKHGKKRDKIVLETPNKLDAMKEFHNLELGVIVKMREIPEPFSLKVQKLKDKYTNPIKNTKVDIESYISVLNQLAVMLDAGMPINSCLSESQKSTENLMLKAILDEVSSDVESGTGLANAFKPYSRQLGNLSISMIDLGEQTGTLSESIARLADILQNIHDNRVKLKKATRYPLFTMIAMSIAFTVVITFVVPQFESLFSEMKTELPFPTLILLWLENAISTYGPYILIGAVLLAVVYSKMYKNSEKIALMTDKFMLKVYIIGIVTRFAMLGRFVYIFNVLVDAGIPIIDALRAATDIVDNKYMKLQFETIKEAIEEGKSLYEGFVDSNLFESMILQMLKAGEDAGALNKMLDKITIFYEKKYDNIIDNVSAMIEPIMIGAIAGFVLILALGIFLPMWSMAEAMGM